MALPIQPPAAGQRTDQLWKTVRDVVRTAAPASEVDRLKQDVEDLRQLVRRKNFGEGGSVVLQRFVVVSAAGDFVSCRPAKEDGTADTAAELVRVAKPYPLRSSTFADKVIDRWYYPGLLGHLAVRTGTAGNPPPSGVSQNATFSEELSVNYTAGMNDIYGVEADTGVNGVDWLDLNISARHWRLIKTEVKVCVLVGGRNTTRTMIVGGGPVY